jgi:hypothetical protein
MKVIFSVFMLLLCTVAQSQNAFVAPALESVRKQISTLPKHPRLLFHDQDIPVLRANLNRNPLLEKLHQSIVSECEKLLKVPTLERIQTGKRLLSVSRECLRRVYFLSYAYRMTGNEAYLKRAERELLAVCAFSDWNPSHFLDVAEMTMAVAIGYDWLYTGLSEANRQQIRQAILKLGVEPSLNKKHNSFLNNANNWNQVCNAGMVFGVLAIAEDQPELAATIVHRAVVSVPKSVASYAPDGAYPEGYSYWEYGTSFNVLLVSAFEKAFGTEFGLTALPGFMQAAGFLQNMIGPKYLVHNWGDSGEKAEPSPAMFWYASKLKNHSLVWMDKKLLENSSKGFTSNRILPSLLIWGADVDLSKITPPQTTVWVGQGPNPVGLMRTSWTDDKAFFVGFKGGAGSVPHGHMDVGSFVLDALGERWAMDFGMQNYHSLESKGVDLWGNKQDAQRWRVFRYNNRVHNTLTIDDKLHFVKGYAKVDKWSEKPNSMFVVSDLSKVFTDQAKNVVRGVAILNKKQVLVQDEVAAPGDQAITVRWNMLTAAKVEIVDENTVRLSQNDKTLFLSFAGDDNLKIKTWPTNGPMDYDAPNPGTVMVGFEAIIPAGEQRTFKSVFSEKARPKTKMPSLEKWKN